jgi:hypothetical protein
MGAETTTVPLDVAVLALVGRLDGEAGLRLIERARGALLAGATRLDIDLSEVTAFTSAGSAALLACRDLTGCLVPGDGTTANADVHYRTSRGAGRDALLAAFAEVCDDDLEDGSDLDADPLAIDLRTH